MGPRKTTKSDPSEAASSSAGGGMADSEYLAKRARNNEAVKRSREKAREKAKETTGISIIKPEAVFLVVCDPPMNKLWVT